MECGADPVVLQVPSQFHVRLFPFHISFDNVEPFQKRFYQNIVCFFCCHVRFVTSWVRIETSPGHVPVATISWSPCSNYLISGSPADTSLVVWDVPMGVATRVRRREGGGVCLVSVSPGGARVLAASVGGVIRVWETENWTCEKWNGMGTGRCQAACWSPLGDFLLFALSGDHTLYYIGFHGNDTASMFV